MKKRTQTKQSIFDVSEQNFGDMNNIVRVSKDNNISLNEEIPANTELTINNSGIGNQEIKDDVIKKGISFNNISIETFEIVFFVTDSEGVFLSGATVVFDGETKITNGVGKSYFFRGAGTYSYTVNKTGFGEETGTPTISADTNISVSMSPPVSGVKYGYLYNWFTTQEANFAPTDWKVPTRVEIETARAYLIANGFNYDDTTTGNKIGKSIASNSGWIASITVGAIGNTDFPLKQNITNLSFLPSGARINLGFRDKETNNYIWSETELSGNGIFFGSNYDAVLGLSIGSSIKIEGLAIRLLWNGTGTPPAQITDYDGNLYDVVQIGSQYWLVQNWACTKLNDGTPLTKVTDQTAWNALTTEGYCAYDNDENNVFL